MTHDFPMYLLNAVINMQIPHFSTMIKKCLSPGSWFDKS